MYFLTTEAPAAPVVTAQGKAGGLQGQKLVLSEYSSYKPSTWEAELHFRPA